MAERNILSQSIFSDLKAQGANEAQIREMFGYRQSPVDNNNNINNNIKIDNNNNNIKKEEIKESKEEKEKREREIAKEILKAIAMGNKDGYLASDDLEVLKRDDSLADFSQLPNGICSFLGRKNSKFFDPDYHFPRSRLRSVSRYGDDDGDDVGDDVVVSSLVFHNSSVSFLRKSLAHFPLTREESELTMGENGLALLTNPSFPPLLYEWKRNEIIGEAKDILEVIGKHPKDSKREYPTGAIADEAGKLLFLPSLSPSSSSSSPSFLNLIEYPFDMSLPLRLFHLYSFDPKCDDRSLPADDDVDGDPFLSFYSPSRRSRVRGEENKRYKAKITKSWIIIIEEEGPKSQTTNLILYFIDRSSFPDRSANPIDLSLSSIFQSENSGQIGYEMNAMELTAYKVEVKGIEGRINDVAVAWEDGGASNVCIAIVPAGQSFHRFDRISKSDKLRRPSSLSSSSLSSSLSSSSLSSSHISAHRLDDHLVGFPCADQSSDAMTSSIRHVFVDPRNPPPLQISRDLSLSPSFKGSVAVVTPRSLSRDSFLYLSIGSWPELDIHRTSSPSNLLLPPPSRHFPSLFSSSKCFLFPRPAFVFAASFLPFSSPSSPSPSFSFSSSEGWVVMGVVTEEEGRVVEEVEIFDTRDFEKGPAFILRPKHPLEHSFNFGISNYLSSFASLPPFLH